MYPRFRDIPRDFIAAVRGEPWFGFAWFSWLLFDVYAVAVQSGWVGPC